MEIADFFVPVEFQKIDFSGKTHPLLLGNVINSHNEEGQFPSLDDIHIAIVGVKEDRNAADNQGCAFAPDYIRKYLYNLYQGPFKLKLADLGNIRQGETTEDTYFAVKTVIAALLEKKIIPLVLGGSQDISYANYRAYESLGQIINIVNI
ncbi:MAG: arginase family protein, partial [Bacteroidota bacterium]